MKKFAFAAFAAIALIALAGCTTTAGPFVTNVSTDGDGSIIVEKNTVEMNWLMGTVSSGKTPIQNTLKVVK